MKSITIKTIRNSQVSIHNSIREALEHHGLFTSRTSLKEGVRKLQRNSIEVFDENGVEFDFGEVKVKAKKQESEQASEPIVSSTNQIDIASIVQQELAKALRGFDNNPQVKTNTSNPLSHCRTIDEALNLYQAPSVERDSYYVSDDVWKQVLYAFKNNKPILLTGQSGTGKTDLVRVIGERLSLDVHSVDCSALEDSVEAFIGKRELKDGNTTFEPSKFSHEIAKHQIVLLDEVSRAPYGSNNILFPLLDHRKTLINPYAEDGNVKADCFFIATANEGANFSGTSSLDEAFRNRFYVINIDYAPKEIEQAILEKRDGISKKDASTICDIAQQIRAQYTEGSLSRSVSLRELFIASEQLAFGFDLTDALENAFIGGYQVEEQLLIRDLIRTK
jgi:nitric oxide reductase NorQ protein